jgi:hypothetical protein
VPHKKKEEEEEKKKKRKRKKTKKVRLDAAHVVIAILGSMLIPNKDECVVRM